MIFWLVLQLENRYRVIISWRILVSFRDCFEDYIFAWWNIWVSIIILLPEDTFQCKWQGHSVTRPLFFLKIRNQNWNCSNLNFLNPKFRRFFIKVKNCLITLCTTLSISWMVFCLCHIPCQCMYIPGIMSVVPNCLIHSKCMYIPLMVL